MARRQPAVAWMSAVLFLSLLLPAAGKTLIQTTPMRLIVAVVPIGATPLIEVLSRRSRLILVLFALLLILSLDNALAYNFHHDRVMDILVDSSFSGWKVNLLFPYQSRQPWQVSPANGVLLLFWLTAVGALLMAPAWIQRWRPRASDHASVRLGLLAVTAAAIFIALGTAVSAATGAWTWRKYLMIPRDAARQAALLLDDLGRCAICYSSEDGPIGRKDAVVGAQRLILHLESVDPSVATRGDDSRIPGYSDWLEMPGRIRAWYAEANGHDPTNGELGHFMYQWREERVPPSEIRRRIFASAAKTPP
jgi:hypothetical protein